ncbi:RNA polymerase sigma-70 factor [Larkinella insperata]|uniref:RNA polymerase sigma-70 factor n=1 Tax=Larkinella insperata TaxID=332158 RepID=A0ABW3QNL8_9BACT
MDNAANRNGSLRREQYDGRYTALDEEWGNAVGVLDAERLIRKAFETDSNQGIELLFHWYYRPLCSHAVRYVSSKEIAEDIVSDVFFQFHSGHVFEKVTTSFRAYLFTSVRYRAFNYVRAEMSRSTAIDHAENVSIEHHQYPDQITQFEDLYHDVEEAINTLPRKRRKIYIMHRFEGKRYQDIAQELNLSLRTVEAQVYLALHQVRKLLRHKWLLLLLLAWSD